MAAPGWPEQPQLPQVGGHGMWRPQSPLQFLPCAMRSDGVSCGIAPVAISELLTASVRPSGAVAG